MPNDFIKFVWSEILNVYSFSIFSLSRTAL